MIDDSILDLGSCRLKGKPLAFSLATDNFETSFFFFSLSSIDASSLRFFFSFECTS